ncbi:histone H1-delta-like [Liolophura sinensis]|uniref:histone H1-delta-like n=1 Tax=Liolophura sinensis TaxID=3198878 RepID=UPI0031587A06
MTDTAPAPVVQKVKKTTKPKKPAEHPKYSEMVVAALKDLKERGGSSRSKILKYIVTNYKVGDEKTVNTHLKLALKSGVQSGMLKQTKGTGATGSFKLGETAKKASVNPKKAAVKKAAAKKPATKKTKSPKKVTKKPAAKKLQSPAKEVTKKAKSPKKVAKKPASKKPAKSPKKPAVKKPTAKKAAAKKPATKKTKA